MPDTKANVDLYIVGRQGAIMTRIGIIQVGQVYRISPDDEPQEWEAWMWPKPGQIPSTDTHTPAITCKGPPDKLGAKLRSLPQWWA